MTKKKMLSEIKNIDTIVSIYKEFIEINLPTYDDSILRHFIEKTEISKENKQILTDFVQHHYCGNTTRCLADFKKKYDDSVIEKFEIRPQSSQSINDGGYYKRRVIKVIRKY